MAKRSTDAQMSLVPPRPLAQSFVAAQDVDELVGKGKGKLKLLGPPPDHSFIESIRLWGVLEPIKLKRLGNGWKMEDGFRRLRSVIILRDQAPPEDWGESTEAWRARWSTVPAFVVEASNGWHDGLLSLTLNEQRSDNLAVLLVYVEQLAQQGHSEHEIYEATGVPVVRIRKVLQLTALHDDLRAGFMAGKIVATVALAASKCTAEQQAELVKVYRGEGQLTASDVREVKRADARQAQAALSNLGDGDAGQWWIDEVRRKLGECLAIVPENEIIRIGLQNIVDILDDKDRIVRSTGGSDLPSEDEQQAHEAPERDEVERETAPQEAENVYPPDRELTVVDGGRPEPVE